MPKRSVRATKSKTTRPARRAPGKRKTSAPATRLGKLTQASPLIAPGKPAPAFTLPDQTGRLHQLSDYLGQWVVLYFYPKDDTPGCTREACQFRDRFKEFAKHNAVVLGVSPDSQGAHQKFAAKYDLPFPLLADTEKKLVAAYGVWQQKVNYGRTYWGVVRTTYLINPQGQVSQRWDKVQVTDHETEVLQAITQHQ